MDILVGYSGFVGSNLHRQHGFDAVYRSTDIATAYGSNPSLCVYSGVRAEKFLANQDPERDLAGIHDAMTNIERINPKRLVLISTIDVYMNPDGYNEDAPVLQEGLHPYGLHRYLLEQWAAQHVEHCHIVRLPALFGPGIKKNYIHDLIDSIPFMLVESKYHELAAQERLIASDYKAADNGFYRCTASTKGRRALLLDAFERQNFTALNFTDSRSIFQFYNLEYLWQHLQTVVANDIPLVHLAAEPVAIKDVYQAVKGKVFTNEISKNPPKYDFRTKYSEYFGAHGDYLMDKTTVLSDIVAFIRQVGGKP